MDKNKLSKPAIAQVSKFTFIAGTLALFPTPKAYALTPPIVTGSDPTPLSAIEQIIGNIIASVLPIAGIVLFVMLVMGGIKYLSSGGNPESLQKAKGAITYAIVGVALLVLAWVALLFIENFTGVEVTTFTLPTL